MTSHQHTFTVFTPTYDRAHTLGQVYESLCAQTYRDFEWLIVDDGSTDHTPELVAGWQEEAPFLIRYFRQPNQGKHVAFNHGVREARGLLFLTLDSDDTIVPQALERLWHHWQAIPNEKRDGFAAVTALCQDQDGRVVGERFPRDILDSNASELKHRYKVHGEKWGFTRTDLLRAQPYPEMPGVRFVPESVVWIPIAAHHQTRFVNEPLRIYHSSAGGQLSTAGLRRDHLVGLALWHLITLNFEAGWFWQDPLDLLRSGANYARFSFLAGRGLQEQARELRGKGAWLLWLMGLAPGWLKTQMDRSRLID
jgi:glycosyltransferase involved in cell wall biosynthesis